MDGDAIRIDAPRQIIAIGDSLTAGSMPGITEYAPFAEPVNWKLLATSYPHVLGKMLSGNDAGDLILNLGRSGSTTREWLPGARWEKMDVKNFPLNGPPLDEIMQFSQKVKLALVMLGTNDVCQSMVPDPISRRLGGVVGYEDEAFIPLRENLIVILAKLREQGIAPYLAKIPPILYRGGLAFAQLDRLLFFTAKVQQRFDLYVRMVNARIEEICTSYPLLARKGPDFYSLFKDRSDIWVKDRLHFNDTGYRLMAEAWADLLITDGNKISL